MTAETTTIAAGAGRDRRAGNGNALPAGSGCGQWRGWRLAAAVLGLAAASAGSLSISGVPAEANPKGGQVVGGSAAISQTSPTQLDIVQATPRAAINWQSFNIAPSEQTNFQQPAASSVALNRVQAGDPSVIAGRLTANGSIVLINPSGIAFSKGAQVNVNSLIATPTDITNANFMAGRMRFDKASSDPRATVVNSGTITVAQRGLAALVAPGVANSGVVQARLGRVVLAGAKTYTVDFYGDGLVSFDVGPKVTTVPVGATGQPVKSLVSNRGRIDAPGGTVLLTADAVGGIIQNVVDVPGQIIARASGTTRGRVTIDAGAGGGANVSGAIDVSGLKPGQTGGSATVTGGAVAVASSARIDARGNSGGGTVWIGGGPHGTAATLRNAAATSIAKGAIIDAGATGRGNGGQVAVWSNQATRFAGTIKAEGGPLGGNGGWVETSGKSTLAVLPSAQVDAAAPNGTPGTWLLDPANLTVTATNAAVFAATLNGGTSVTLSTVGTPGTQNGDITVATDGAISWTTPSTLTLDAAGDVSLLAPITGSNPGSSVALNAGGAVSQSAAGIIAAETLEVTSVGAVSLTAANAVGVLRAKVTGAGNSFAFRNGGHDLTIESIPADGSSFAGVTTNGGSITVATTGTSTSGFNLTIAPEGPRNLETSVTSDGAPITLMAGGHGGTFTNDGTVDSTSASPAAAGDIAILADAMTLDRGVIDAATPGASATVVLGPATATSAVALGGTGSPGTVLGLMPVDIGTVTAGALQIGYPVTSGAPPFTGSISIASSITIDTTKIPSLLLVTGGSVTEAQTGVVNSMAGGPLALGIVATGSVSMGEANQVGTLNAVVNGSSASNFLFRNNGASLTINNTVLPHENGVSFDPSTGIPNAPTTCLPAGSACGTIPVSGTPPGISTNGGNLTAVTIGTTTTGFNLTVDAPVSSLGGTITLMAGGSGGLFSNFSTVDSTSGAPAAAGNIVILADAMSLAPVILDGTINAGTSGTVVLGPVTAATPIVLGGAAPTGSFGLAQSDIDTISAAMLQIGYRNEDGTPSLTGKIGITGSLDIDTTKIPSLLLVTGGGVTEASGESITSIPTGSLALGVIAGRSVAMGQPNAIGTLAGFVDGAATNTFFFENSGAALIVDSLPKPTLGVAFNDEVPSAAIASGPGTNPLSGITAPSGGVTVSVIGPGTTGFPLTVAAPVLSVDGPIVLTAAATGGAIAVDAAVGNAGSGSMTLTAGTGGLTIDAPITTAPTVPAYGVNLVSAGPITESAAGSVITDNLRALTEADGGASIALTSASNNVSGVVTLTALDTAGTVLAPGAISFVDSTGFTVDAVLGGGQGGLELGANTSGSIFLSAGGPLNIDSLVNAPGTATALGEVTLIATGAISEAGSAAKITAPDLVVRTQNEAGAAITLENTANAVPGDVTLSALNAAGNAPAPGAIAFVDSTGFTVAAQPANGLNGQEIGVNTNADVSLTGGGTITVSGAVGNPATEAISLAADTGDLLINGAITSGVEIRLSADSNLTLAANLSAPAVFLDASGAITQSAGVISATTLDVFDDGGSVSLPDANAVGTLTGFAEGTFLFRDDGRTLTVGCVANGDSSDCGVTTDGKNIVLETTSSGNLVLSQTVNANNNPPAAPSTILGSTPGLIGLSSAGSITQDPTTGLIVGSGLEIQSVGAVSLGAANRLGANDVPQSATGVAATPGTLAGDVTTAGQSFLFRDDRAGLTIGTVDVVDSFGERQSNPQTLAALPVGGLAGVTTNGTAAAANIILETTTAGNLALEQMVNANNGSLALGATAGAVALASAGTITQDPAPIIASSLGILSADRVSLGAFGGVSDLNKVGTLAAEVLNPGESFVFRNDAASLTIGTADITDSFGTRLLDPLTRVELTGALTGVVTNNANIGLRVTTSGDLTLAASVDAGTAGVGLESAGRVLQPGGAVTGGTLEVSAAGPVSLPDANAVPVLAGQATGASSSILFRDDGLGLTVGTTPTLLETGTGTPPNDQMLSVAGLAGVTTAGGDIALQTTTAGDLTLSQNVDANGGLVALSSAGNALEIGGAIVAASGLIVDAAGSVGFGIAETGGTAILGSVNDVGTVAGSAGGVFGFLNGPALTIGDVPAGVDVAGQSGITASAAAGGDILVQTAAPAAPLTLAGNLAAGGRTILDTGGAFAQTGTVSVSDPVLVVDTTGSGIAELLAIVTSPAIGAGAVAGLPPAGTSSNPLQFGGLAAAHSTVLLFADRGMLTGTMAVGGLGLSGTGSSASLFGSIAGNSGPTAALLGVRDPGPEATYLFNNCIIAAISCVVQPAAVIIAPQPPTAFLTVPPQPALEITALIPLPDLAATLDFITPEAVQIRQQPNPEAPVINIYDEERLCDETGTSSEPSRERCQERLER